MLETQLKGKDAPTKWERVLPIDAQLKSSQKTTFVIQSTNSPGSEQHPRWSTLYWWAYGSLLDDYKQHPARVKSASDHHPEFSDFHVCEEVLNLLRAKHKARRHRMIVRTETIHEILVMN
jgi:hypothetical protein